MLLWLLLLLLLLVMLLVVLLRAGSSICTTSSGLRFRLDICIMHGIFATIYSQGWSWMLSVGAGVLAGQQRN